jgi:hypothetical protein
MNLTKLIYLIVIVERNIASRQSLFRSIGKSKRISFECFMGSQRVFLIKRENSSKIFILIEFLSVPLLCEEKGSTV